MPALIERPKMTKTMYQALKRHVIRERDKKKLELEQDAEFERIKKERELKKKKEQEDSLTLEQTKEQVIKNEINQLDKKLESLKDEKHQLFSELKKVLHQEDETRRRAQMKEHNELASMGQQPSYMGSSAHPMFLQTAGHMPGRPTLYKPAHHMLQPVTGIKRQRSPSPPPPPASIYHQYPDGKYAQAAYVQAKPGAYTAGQTKHGNYQQTTSGHVYPGSQSAHTYQQQSGTYPANQSASSKYPSGQSAFSSYPGHYTTTKQLAEHYPAGYARLQQPGYIGGHTSSLPLQQQLEHASQKSGFSEEKYKLQVQQSALRGMAGMTPQQQALQQVHAAAAQQAQQAQAQPKGGIVSGYPVRTQAQSSSSYQTYSSQQNGSQRHGYHGSQQRFF